MKGKKINMIKLEEELEKELNKKFKDDLFKLNKCRSPLSGLNERITQKIKKKKR
ncbi:MAG: hypothetical protein ACFE8A_10540 [Candidatus Hodarchaeota archaeon]